MDSYNYYGMSYYNNFSRNNFGCLKLTISTNDMGQVSFPKHKKSIQSTSENNYNNYTYDNNCVNNSDFEKICIVLLGFSGFIFLFIMGYIWGRTGSNLSDDQLVCLGLCTGIPLIGLSVALFLLLDEI